MNMEGAFVPTASIGEDKETAKDNALESANVREIDD